jgi:anaphase-promoting complex subunit 1
MAGTGDVIVFRRLRRLHGNTGPDVPYGSHFASHLAMGVIFLGNGAFTFGTSNIAVAALMCAFYPLFPTTPLDNKSHLQAFRHFWVLAVENRCIVPRDVETFRPCQIPIAVTLKSGEELRKIAPCLLPELDTIATVTTTSPEHWTVVLDFANSRLHREAFERSQSIYVHRRSAHASQSTVFQAALQALDDVENLKAPLEWIGQLPAFAGLDKAEKALVIREGESGGGEAVDERLELEEALKRAENRSRIRGVAVVTARKEGQGGLWIGDEVTEKLRAGVWVGDGV